MPKRFAGDGTLEAYYVRRVLNEVDICNHLGRRVAPRGRCRCCSTCRPGAHRHTGFQLHSTILCSQSCSVAAVVASDRLTRLHPSRRSLNVCYLYEVFEDDSCVDLVMELCSGGQLWDKCEGRRCGLLLPHAPLAG